jgi:hypothetical protein
MVVSLLTLHLALRGPNFERLGMRTLLLVFCGAAVCSIGMTGCATGKPKSSARIYDGDAPTIRITGEETAGGRLGGR